MVNDGLQHRTRTSYRLVSAGGIFIVVLALILASGWFASSASAEQKLFGNYGGKTWTSGVNQCSMTMHHYGNKPAGDMKVNRGYIGHNPTNGTVNPEGTNKIQVCWVATTAPGVYGKHWYDSSSKTTTTKLD